MEFTLLGGVATLGASFVVVATLVLFTLHAVDGWRPRRIADLTLATPAIAGQKLGYAR